MSGTMLSQFIIQTVSSTPVINVTKCFHPRITCNYIDLVCINKNPSSLKCYRCKITNRYVFSGNINDMLVETLQPDGKLVWKCVLCTKEFPHKCSGRRHIETVHFDAPTYKCDVCGKVLKNKNTYQNHLNITHGIQKRPGLKNRM